MAERCAAGLKPYGFTLEHAVEHFIDHLARRSVGVATLVTEYKSMKRRFKNRSAT